MKLYGLIGYPLGHSFSQRYFTINSPPQESPTAPTGIFRSKRSKASKPYCKTPGLRGFNVTIPYKQAIVPYLSGLSDEARAIGAVNCVKITPEGLTGYNTDAYGFRRSLLNLLGDVRPEKALVLGTGGASKAVKYVLEQLGIAFDAVSRDGKNGAYTYGDLSEEIVRAHRLIVNATPLGTFPNAEGCPVLPYEALGAGHFLFDLVYNPAVTEFLKRGAAQGGCNPQRLRHAGRAGRKSMGDLERIIVRTIQKRKSCRSVRQPLSFFTTDKFLPFIKSIL